MPGQLLQKNGKKKYWSAYFFAGTEVQLQAKSLSKSKAIFDRIQLEQRTT